MTKRQSSIERLGNFKVTFDDATDQILGLVDAHGQERQLVTATTSPGGGTGIKNILSLTQAQYDAIVTKDAATLYVIVEG